MIKFKNVSLRRGNKVLLNQANVSLFNGQKVGLVGANGAGKSSLFALLRGELHLDAGEVDIPARATIAHVAQETPALNCSALDYTLDGDVELRHVEERLAHSATDLEYVELLVHYEDIGGYTAVSRASKLLSGLGFNQAEINLPVASFSGGWRMRLNLAQALMCRSDILLLDEPTNHLDLETVLWLEDFLRAYPGTLILISHDRDFLDSLIEHIVHLDQGVLTLYTGNYSAYEGQKAEKMLQQQAAFEKQQQQVEHLESYINRFRAKATKAKQAQSRIKALARMDKIAALHAHSPFQFSFLEPTHSPNPLLRMDEGSFSYHSNDTPTLSALNLSIEEGARLGLLGPNGAGKSTLIKLLANTQFLQVGERVEGRGLKIGYFAQHQLEALRAEYSPIWHMRQLDKDSSEQLHRNFLGGFHFHGELASSPVENFSGGEKARLSLALLIWQKPNLLLLDEPTNHLDLEMRDALTLALQDYQGALVVVSHDRHFLRVITDTFWLVDKGKVQVFDGDLDDYRQYVDKEKSQAKVALKKTKIVSDKETTKKSADIKEKDKANNHKQSAEKKLQQIEKVMASLQEQQQKVEVALTDTTLYTDAQKGQLQLLLDEANAIQKSLQENEEIWLELHEELER